MPPLLTFNRTFDALLTIGETEVPIHVARLTRAQLDEIDEGWNRLIVAPRGSAPQPSESATTAEREAYLRAELDRFADWNKTVEKDRLAFFEEIIGRYVTVDAGLIEDCGQAVTDGAGLLKIFHGRRDVLRDLISAVITKNHLTELMAKNSASPRAFDGGLAPLIPARGGDGQGSTASSAASSSTAESAAATDESSEPADASASSGEHDGATKVH